MALLLKIQRFFLFFFNNLSLHSIRNTYRRIKPRIGKDVKKFIFFFIYSTLTLLIHRNTPKTSEKWEKSIIFFFTYTSRHRRGLKFWENVNQNTDRKPQNINLQLQKSPEIRGFQKNRKKNLFQFAVYFDVT